MILKKTMLGRPFLATRAALIDVKKGELVKPVKILNLKFSDKKGAKR